MHSNAPCRFPWGKGFGLSTGPRGHCGGPSGKVGGLTSTCLGIKGDDLSQVESLNVKQPDILYSTPTNRPVAWRPRCGLMEVLVLTTPGQE